MHPYRESCCDKLIIGISAEISAGKSTAARALNGIIGPSSRIVGISGFYSQLFDEWGIPKERANYIRTWEFFFGIRSDALMCRTFNAIERMEEPIIILEGLRLMSDHEIITSQPRHARLHIVASRENRFQRARLRGEKVGEANMTMADFILEDEGPNEHEVALIGAMPGVAQINNDGTQQELERQLATFWSGINAG